MTPSPGMTSTGCGRSTATRRRRVSRITSARFSSNPRSPDQAVLQRGRAHLDPFGGLFTVPYRALKLRRRGGASGLKPGYFLDGIKYLHAMERVISTPRCSTSSNVRARPHDKLNCSFSAGPPRQAPRPGLRRALALGRWLRQIWRHIRRHVWREFRVIWLRDRRLRHSNLLFDGQPMLGSVCSTTLWRGLPGSPRQVRPRRDGDRRGLGHQEHVADTLINMKMTAIG